jgi:hypothetical protein
MRELKNAIFGVNLKISPRGKEMMMMMTTTTTKNTSAEVLAAREVN